MAALAARSADQLQPNGRWPDGELVQLAREFALPKYIVARALRQA